jgi:signal transduction histidine kinase/ActR/RegA family two-component response regulator
MGRIALRCWVLVARLRYLALAVFFLGHVPGSNAHAAPPPQNLLSKACHFYSDIQAQFPSMLSAAEGANCETPAKPSRQMVWLSLSGDYLTTRAGKHYELAIFRHWTERAVVQIHYANGHMVAYDVDAYEFANHWSVGNFVTFDAPAHTAAVSHILVGLQNPSSIKLFRQINFVEAESWNEIESTGRILTTLLAGILVAMLCYNMVLAGVLKFDFHIHYCLFVFSIFLYNIVAYGLVAHYFPGAISVTTQMNITILALALNGLSGIYFIGSFLEAGIVSDRWKQLGKAIAYTFVGVSTVYVSARGWHADITDLLFNLLSLAGIAYVFITLVRALRRGSRASIFYAIGWVLPIIGVAMRILRGFDIIPHSSLVEYGMSIGMALETIILSIGIADRISQIRKERDKALLAEASASAASRAKSDFLAHMSHEIRTPMNAIMGMSDFMAKTKLDTTQRRYMDDIQTSSRVLMNLLNGVLDYSKIEAGRVDLETIEFDPAAIFADVYAVTNQRAHEKGISLAIKGVETLPPVLIGDPTRLSQILINLTNNAVKFTEKGGVTIRVSVERNVEANATLKCQIDDTGIGMAPEQMSNLFQSFNQADTSITRRFGGSGLGLSICKQLVELMGGTIGVDSVPGRGSSFYFSVPMQVAEVGSLSSARPAETVTHLAGTRMLLVEDNEINQRLAGKLLSIAGVSFDIADGGYAAIKQVADTKYDLILMDLNLPDIDGLEATKTIRAMENGATTPIVALTGNDDQDSRDACVKAGMDGLIAKPFNPVTLYATLERSVEKTASL